MSAVKGSRGRGTARRAPVSPSRRGAPLDTSPEAMEVYWQTLRKLGPAGRLRRMQSLNEQAVAISAAGVRARHPDYTEEQVHYACVRLRLGEKLFREVFSGIEVAP